MGMLDENIDYVLLSNELIKEVLDDLKIIAATFITPYPPGFPIIVPGQIISYDLLLYLKTIKIKEIHGYHPEKGIKVFTADFLKDLRG
jgi:arginine decarboxylase